MVPVYTDVLKRFTFSFSRESVGDIFRSLTCNLGEINRFRCSLLVNISLNEID